MSNCSDIFQLITAFRGFLDICSSKERELRLTHNLSIPLKNYQTYIYRQLGMFFPVLENRSIINYILWQRPPHDNVKFYLLFVLI